MLFNTERASFKYLGNKSQQLPHIAFKTFFAKDDINTDDPSLITPDGASNYVSSGASRIFGSFQTLKTLTHPNLANYIEVSKSSNGRLFIISEHFADNAFYKLNYKEDITNNERKERKTEEFNKMFKKIVFEILSACWYLHDNGIVHGNLSCQNILLSTHGNVKLVDYGINFITNGGEDVAFPMGYPEYLAPEVLVNGKQDIKSDIWSLGVCLAEIYLGQHFWNFNEKEIEQKLLQLSNCYGSLTSEMLQTKSALKYISDDQVLQFLKLLLENDPEKRPTCQTLLTHPFLKGIHHDFILTHEKPVLLSSFLPLTHSETFPEEPGLSCSQLYHLYRIGGNQLELELKRYSVHRPSPSIERLPYFVTFDGEEVGSSFDRAHRYSNSFFYLSLNSLMQKVLNIHASMFQEIPSRPECLIPFLFIHPPILPFVTYSFANSATKIASICEKDQLIAYQYVRIQEWNDLFSTYPTSRNQILLKARGYIPSIIRGQVWAAILYVHGSYQEKYTSILKEKEEATDRQIDVDIPRCHQYHQLLCTDAAHAAMKRMLKAWLQLNPGSVYWQGLDSICAIFLSLNFSDEALAFDSFHRFIGAILPYNFTHNNTKVIAIKLQIFLSVFAYHDPVLYQHLQNTGFHPELYAIPWFLTNFAHIFTLEKLYYLFDFTLLTWFFPKNSNLHHDSFRGYVGSPFPLFFAVAILIHHRTTLLQQNFDDCIHFFSEPFNLPFEKCLENAIHMYHTTPQCIYSIPVRGAKVGSPILRFNYGDTPSPNEVRLHPRQAIPSFIRFEDFLQLYPMHCIVTDIRSQELFCQSHIGGSTWLSIGDPELDVEAVFSSSCSLKSLHVFVVEANPNEEEEQGSNIETLQNIFQFLVQHKIYGICFLEWDAVKIQHSASTLNLFQAPLDSPLTNISFAMDPGVEEPEVKESLEDDMHGREESTDLEIEREPPMTVEELGHSQEGLESASDHTAVEASQDSIAEAFQNSSDTTPFTSADNVHQEEEQEQEVDGFEDSTPTPSLAQLGGGSVSSSPKGKRNKKKKKKRGGKKTSGLVTSKSEGHVSQLSEKDHFNQSKT